MSHKITINYLIAVEIKRILMVLVFKNTESCCCENLILNLNDLEWEIPGSA